MNRSRYATRPKPAVTACQHQVWKLLAEGKDSREIGDALGMRYGTVKAHCTELYRRIGARNRVEAALRYHGIAA